MSRAWVVFYQAQLFFEWPVGKVGQQLHPENPFAEAVAAAGLIHEHSAATARVAVIGSEPELYFDAHRLSATPAARESRTLESWQERAAARMVFRKAFTPRHKQWVVACHYK
jgi:hypothetical protein